MRIPRKSPKRQGSAETPAGPRKAWRHGPRETPAVTLYRAERQRRPGEVATCRACQRLAPVTELTQAAGGNHWCRDRASCEASRLAASPSKQSRGVRCAKCGTVRVWRRTIELDGSRVCANSTTCRRLAFEPYVAPANR